MQQSDLKRFRNFCVTPWRGRSLNGTYYTPFDGHPDQVGLTRAEIDGFAGEVNTTCSGVGLLREDVSRVFVGLVPRERGAAEGLHQAFLDRRPQGVERL